MQLQERETDRLGLLQIIRSVLMSFLGVQKDQVRERDFRKGRPVEFIITGLVLTLVFILVIYLIVKLILYFALQP